MVLMHTDAFFAWTWCGGSITAARRRQCVAESAGDMFSSGSRFRGLVEGGRLSCVGAPSHRAMVRASGRVR